MFSSIFIPRFIALVQSEASILGHLHGIDRHTKYGAPSLSIYYFCDDSTNHEDFQTSFPSQLTRNPPPFPNLSVTKKNKMMPTKPHSITLLYLLAQAGDLHPNPGPNSSITQTPPQNYPCGTCRQEVHDQDHAIQCDECDHWYHTAYVQMDDTSYKQLKSHSVLWFCSCCGLPNYSNCLFSSNISTSNPYSVLDTPADSRDYPNMSEEPSTTFAPNPANTSTPERKKCENQILTEGHVGQLQQCQKQQQNISTASNNTRNRSRHLYY